jgi:hypothetical protein
MNVLDRIVVVGYDKSFEDDVIIALNGQEVMSLALFHEINCEGVQDHTEGGKSDVRCNNINVTYGLTRFAQPCVDTDALSVLLSALYLYLLPRVLIWRRTCTSGAGSSLFCALTVK